MKGMIFAVLLVIIIGASSAGAAVKVKDGPQTLDDAVKFGVIQSLTACVEGHMFLITYAQTPITTKGRSYGMTVSTVQIYEERDGRSVPMRCR